MRKTVSGIMVTLLLMSMLTLAFEVDGAVDRHAPSFQTFSEPPPTEWSKTYGGTGDDGASALVQTSDGGYALAGETDSSGAGGDDFWLIKTDASGNTQWSRTYGGTNDERAYSVVRTGDGGYAIAGYTNSFGAGGADFWLVKIDVNGNAQWSRTYGGTGPDYVRSVVQTGDGGYALAGATLSFGLGAADFWLVKTDSSGNMQWNKRYGGDYWDRAYSVVQTGDGGYALAGYTESYGAGSYDSWLVKTDASGNMQWSKTYGGTGYDDAYSVVQTGDGGYAITGETYSYGGGKGEAWLVKTDVSGNMQWSKTYGGPGTYDDIFQPSMIQTGDGGYALTGSIHSNLPNSSDFWLVKTDANGNMKWNETYGGTVNEYAYSLVQTSEGGYAVAGWTNSFGAGGYDFWLVKVGGTSPPPGPQITSIDPSQPIAGAGRQMLSILGEGFVPNSEVTLKIGSTPYLIPPDRTSFMSANKIEIIAGLGTVPSLWKALVTNPVGIQSNEYPFEARSVLDEDIRKVLARALQYWTAEDAVIMTAIAGGESGWNPTKAFDEGNYPFSYMGHDSWGLWQIFMNVHKNKLGELGAPIGDASQTARWLLNPDNNVKAAYAVWKEAKRIWGDGFRPWSAYTQKNAPSYYKSPLIWNRVINVARQMGISVFKCPVNVTITDDYGRVISEVENQIPGASFEYFNATDTKIFYLPSNLTYNVQMNATDYGNITISQITPLESIYEIAFSYVIFNLTSATLAEFDLLPYDANYTLEVDENGDGELDYELTPEIETITTEYDVGVIEIAPSKTVVGQGYSLPVNITVVNYGAYTETFNITFYANETFIELQTVTLTNGTPTTFTFTWNTTDFAKGNYTISAYAEPVPGETYTADNIFSDCWVVVTIPGDVNGDGWVEMMDYWVISQAYGSSPGDPNWNPNADIYEPPDGDGFIEMMDYWVISQHYGEHYP